MHLLPDGTRRSTAGSGTGSRIFNPATRDMVRGHRHHQLHRHTDLRHIGPAAFDARRTATRPRVMIFGGGNPATRDHRNHRPVRADARVAVRTADVAAANRDERHDPAERQGAGDGRIDQRRGRRNGELECRSLRSDHEHVQLGGRERVSAPLSFRVAAPAGRHGDAGWRQPSPWQLRATHRDLLTGVPVQRRRHAGGRDRP